MSIRCRACGVDVPHPIDGSYYCRDCGASQSAGYRQAELDRQRRADIARAGERARLDRWHATYNAVLQGIYAAETSHLTPAFTERSHKHAARAADLTHGALTTAEP